MVYARSNSAVDFPVAFTTLSYSSCSHSAARVLVVKPRRRQGLAQALAELRSVLGRGAQVRGISVRTLTRNPIASPLSGSCKGRAFLQCP